MLYSKQLGAYRHQLTLLLIIIEGLASSFLASLFYRI